MRNTSRPVIVAFAILLGLTSSAAQLSTANSGLTIAAPPQMSVFNTDSLRGILQRISTYKYGDSRTAIVELDGFIRSVGHLPEARMRVEEELLGFLIGNGTPAGRNIIALKLASVGGERSVPHLSSVLADTAVGEMALYALECIPGPRADTALQQTAATSTGRRRLGAINALGNRKVEMAVGDLERYASLPDTAAAEASISALGRLGSQPAIDALGRVAKTASVSGHATLSNALLNCADNLRMSGDSTQALKLYDGLLKGNEQTPIRRAALRGVVLSDPDNAATVLANILRSKDASLQPVAVQLVREIRDIQKVRSIASNLPELPEANQVQLLTALSPFRDADVQSRVVTASRSRDPGVRIAAIKTLGSMGDASVVSLLAGVAATSRGAEQKEARSSLAMLHAPGADDSLIALLSRAEGNLEVECVKAAGVRGVTPAVPLLLQSARHPLGTIRIESAKALKAVADSTHLPAIVDILMHPRDPEDRRELELAVAAVARRITEVSNQDKEILRVYPSASDLLTRASLITVLGKIGAPASLSVLREALDDGNADIRAAAIRSLSEWPTAEPYPDLWRRATEAKVPLHRILSLRGSVRLIGRDTTRPAEQTLQMYKEAMNIAPNDAERKLLLSAIGEVRSIGALRLVASYTSDRTLTKEAEAATLKIAEELTDPMAHEAVPDLRQLAATSRDTAIQSKAKSLATGIERFDDYITTWEFAGPYMKAGARLLDEWFVPELDGGRLAEWKPFASKTNTYRPWLLEFDQVIGGANVVVYVRCNIWSSDNQNAQLEIGSDDGVKVWLNGVLVHMLDVIRGVSAGEDRVPVSLKQGWNVLTMKVRQAGGAWGACARVRTRDGTHLEGLRVSATPN